MKILTLPLAIVFLASLSVLLLFGCVATGGVYYEGGDYYGPYGYDYSGWGPDFYVVPFHEEHHHGDEHRSHVEGRHDERVYRSAPASHSIPSIPSRSHSGGSRSHSNPTRR